MSPSNQWFEARHEVHPLNGPSLSPGVRRVRMRACDERKEIGGEGLGGRPHQKRPQLH